MSTYDDDLGRPRPWWALLTSITALVAAGWLIVDAAVPGAMADHDTVPMIAVAPGGEIELASLSHDHRVLYEAAAEDREAFSEVTCYCGCEAFLDHRHLLDCFERPDGGWERHATGCAVCLAQAEELVEQRLEGVPIDEISRRMDTNYGGITAISG